MNKPAIKISYLKIPVEQNQFLKIREETLQEIVEKEFQARMKIYSSYSEELMKAIYQEIKDFRIAEMREEESDFKAKTPDEMRRELAMRYAKIKGERALENYLEQFPTT